MKNCRSLDRYAICGLLKAQSKCHRVIVLKYLSPRGTATVDLFADDRSGTCPAACGEMFESDAGGNPF